MKRKFPFCIKRIITGLVFAAVVGYGLVEDGWVRFAVILVVSAVALWEFYSLFWGKKGRFPTRICGVLLGWGMLTLTWMQRPQDALVFLGAGFILTALSFLFRIDIIDEENNFAPGSIFLVGLAYVPLLLLPTTYLSSTKLFYVLAVIIAADVSAYFIGVRYGRHKLWKRVSPNKSSEGAFASLIGSVTVSIILGVCLGSAPWWTFALLGVLLNGFAQLGDLFESALKRAVSVKDSSSLLPGHGGCLDRVDSILFGVPVFAVVDQWYKFF